MELHLQSPILQISHIDKFWVDIFSGTAFKVVQSAQEV